MLVCELLPGFLPDAVMEPVAMLPLTTKIRCMPMLQSALGCVVRLMMAATAVSAISSCMPGLVSSESRTCPSRGVFPVVIPLPPSHHPTWDDADRLANPPDSRCVKSRDNCQLEYSLRPLHRSHRFCQR